jgi:hypothetical protein
LPIRVKATGGAIVRSNSWYGGSTGGDASSNTNFNPVRWRRQVTGNGAGQIVVANFRIKSTDGSGDIVRICAELEKLIPYIQANATSQSGAVMVAIHAGVTLGGSPSWSAARADSMVEVDTAGTISSSTILYSQVFGFSDTNQGGTSFGADTISSDRLGLLGYAGDVFSLTTERVLGSGTYDSDTTMIWVEL